MTSDCYEAARGSNYRGLALPRRQLVSIKASSGARKNVGEDSGDLRDGIGGERQVGVPRETRRERGCLPLFGLRPRDLKSGLRPHSLPRGGRFKSNLCPEDESFEFLHCRSQN